MTYDFHGGWETIMDHHSGWTSDGKNFNDPNSELTAHASTKYWLDRGCPAAKMTMGLGAYGRVFKPLDGVNNRLQRGTAKDVQDRVRKTDSYFFMFFGLYSMTLNYTLTIIFAKSIPKFILSNKKYFVTILKPLIFSRIR